MIIPSSMLAVLISLATLAVAAAPVVLIYLWLKEHKEKKLW